MPAVLPARGSRRGSSTRTPRRIAADTVTSTASTSNARGAPTSLISAPARPGPRDLGARRGERVLGVRLDQPVARDDLGEDDLRRAAGDRVDRADDEAADVQPLDREPVGPPGERHAGDDDADRQLAGDVDRQLPDAVEPDADRQREQHERQQLHRRQQAHLRRAGVQQQHGRERQREHRHLPAERADQDRRSTGAGRRASRSRSCAGNAGSRRRAEAIQLVVIGNHVFMVHPTLSSFAAPSRGGCLGGPEGPKAKKLKVDRFFR